MSELTNPPDERAQQTMVDAVGQPAHPLGMHDLELLQMDADLIAHNHQHPPPDPLPFPPSTTHDDLLGSHPGELIHPDDGLPIHLDDHDLQHRLQIDLLLRLDLNGHLGHLHQLPPSGDGFQLGTDEAHLAALFRNDPQPQAYTHTLCKYVLGHQQDTACYGKPFGSKHEAINFVRSNMAALQDMDPSRIDLKIGPSSILDADWRVIINHEIARGTGFIDITVVVRAPSPATATATDAATNRPKVEFLPGIQSSFVAENAVAGPSSHRSFPQPTDLNHQVDSFAYDPSVSSLLPTDPMPDAYPTTSTAVLPFADGYPPPDFDLDSFFAQSQLPFFESFDPPYDPPPSSNHNSFGASDIHMDGAAFYTEPRPPIEGSQVPVNSTADWNFGPAVLNDLLTAAGGEHVGAAAGSSGAVQSADQPSLVAGPPFAGAGDEKPFHAAGLEQLWENGSRPVAPLPAGGLAQQVGMEEMKGKAKEAEKKKEKRTPSVYNVFYTVAYPKTKAENPGMDNAQIIREVARQWVDEPTNPKNVKKLLREDRPPTLYTEYYHLEYARLKAENPSQTSTERNRVVANNWAASPVNPKTRKRKRRAVDAENDDSVAQSPSNSSTDAFFLARRRKEEIARRKVEAEGFARKLAALGAEEARNPRPADYTEMGEEYYSVEDSDDLTTTTDPSLADEEHSHAVPPTQLDNPKRQRLSNPASAVDPATLDPFPFPNETFPFLPEQASEAAQQIRYHQQPWIPYLHGHHHVLVDQDQADEPADATTPKADPDHPHHHQSQHDPQHTADAVETGTTSDDWGFVGQEAAEGMMFFQDQNGHIQQHQQHESKAAPVLPFGGFITEGQGEQVKVEVEEEGGMS